MTQASVDTLGPLSFRCYSLHMNKILIKVCSCGRAHEVDFSQLRIAQRLFTGPTSGIPSEDLLHGHWFNCECKSTLFVSMKLLQENGYTISVD